MQNQEVLLEGIAKLNAEYIVFHGYYSTKDDGDKLNKHTEITADLYLQGLNAYVNYEKDSEDIYNGVFVDENRKIFAEWVINGKETYFEI